MKSGRKEGKYPGEKLEGKAGKNIKNPSRLQKLEGGKIFYLLLTYWINRFLWYNVKPIPGYTMIKNRIRSVCVYR